jgi:hypothetical protein
VAITEIGNFSLNKHVVRPATECHPTKFSNLNMLVMLRAKREMAESWTLYTEASFQLPKLPSGVTAQCQCG